MYPESADAKGHTAAASVQGATILIVEDSPVQAKLLRRTLVAAGYTVIVAGDGAEGLALAKSNNPAAIVSDINMPLMDGYEMCLRLRQDSVLCGTPVILLTTLADARDVVRGLNAGANCYVTKPCNEQFLLSRLGALLAEPASPGETQVEMEAKINGSRFQVRASANRVLDLLVSTYENSVLQNRELAATQGALAALNQCLGEKVSERTFELEQANANLARELGARNQLEEQLRQMNEKLEASVGMLQQRNTHLAMLDRMGNRLQSCHSLDEACQIVADSASQLLPASPGLLALADADGRRFSVAASWGEILIRARTWSNADCHVLRNARPHTANGSSTRTVCTGTCAALDGVGYCIPLVTGGAILGVLHLQGVIAKLAAGDSGSHLEQRFGLRVIDAAAATIGLALTNLRLQEDLREQSLRDPLTGLYNRRYLQDTLAREAARAQRSGTPLGVLMLDIDHFKQVNDTHGHPAGDLVLKWLGRFLRDGVRGADVACRYGGEEFILLAPGATLENAAARAEQIRAGVESESRTAVEGIMTSPITVSLGVAAYCADKEGQASIEDAVQAADDALRLAKRLGRNRIALSGAGAAGSNA